MPWEGGKIMSMTTGTGRAGQAASQSPGGCQKAAGQATQETGGRVSRAVELGVTENGQRRRETWGEV